MVKINFYNKIYIMFYYSKKYSTNFNNVGAAAASLRPLEERLWLHLVNSSKKYKE